MHRRSVFLLILSVVVLLVIGVVMLFSTSAFASETHGNPYFFLRRQLIWMGIGTVACIVAARADHHFWQRSWYIWYGLAIVLLALCFVHPFGQRINGSSRWLNLRVASFQPSELAKLAVIAMLGWWFGRDEDVSRTFLKGFVLPLFACSIPLALIAKEVDMGSTALIAVTAFTVMFVAGTRLLFLVPMILLAGGGLGYAVKHNPVRMGRLMAFRHPELYPAEAYQTEQGLIALGSGGVEGLGLGNGRQKMAYLPEAHTDFIFTMVGEELGLRCTLAIVLSYVVFIMSGAVIAIHAQDRFGLLFGLGFVVLIALQAAVNIGVTTGLLPNKGLPLPFISYGGSNLAFCLLGVGILINIHRQGKSDREVQSAKKMEAHVKRRLCVRL